MLFYYVCFSWGQYGGMDPVVHVQIRLYHMFYIPGATLGATYGSLKSHFW